MRIKLVQNVAEFKQHFGLKKDGQILESDIDVVGNDCDLHERKRRDAETLCTIAANSTGDGLEIGTSTGRSAYAFATNLPDNKIYTVNMLPEQWHKDGGLPTHLIPIREIGAMLRENNIANFEQIYANTLEWEVPRYLSDMAFIFIDGDHATNVVCADSHRFWDRVAPGGYLMWHDFSPLRRAQHDWIDSVMLGVEKFMEERGLDLEVVNIANSWVGVVQKPLDPSRRKTSVPQDTFVELSDNSKPQTCTARDLKTIRAVHAYAAYNDDCYKREEAYVGRMRALGYDLTGFPLECPGAWWPFPKLDDEWRIGNPSLMGMYARLEDLMKGQDVLIADGGSMLHPMFLSKLSAFKILFCADDPEGSEILSRPIATYFDCACPANIACLNDYKAWGCKRVEWVFHGINPADSLPFVNEANFHLLKRDIDIIMLCERTYTVSNRAQRIDALIAEFPQAFVRGSGWPEGRVPEQEPYYARSRIGWNLHNSIGPTNSRVISLPALGVMQICDNKSNLGKILELDKEVVGFDDLKECIDKTRYYLAHENERAEIAWRSWQRVMRDYTEEAKLRKILGLSTSAIQ